VRPALRAQRLRGASAAPQTASGRNILLRVAGGGQRADELAESTKIRAKQTRQPVAWGVQMCLAVAMSAVARPNTKNAESLEELMQAYVEGDTRSFNELYDQTAPEVRRYARRRTKRQEDVEDIVQTTYAKLHRARNRYRPGMPVMPWIMTIVRHSVYDGWRRNTRRREVLAFDGSLPEVANDGLYAYAEQLNALEQALSELPAAQREAFELTRLQELSGDEASERLGTTRTGIKLRVHRAHRTLERLLAA